jgi:CubicO group peptidase (beta-lactamase class C family)
MNVVRSFRLGPVLRPDDESYPGEEHSCVMSTAPTASKVAEALQQIDSWIDPSIVRGAAAVVWKDGDILAERYTGEAQPGVDVDRHTIFPLASVSKPITAAVVMTLVDAGQCALDEPAASFVPEFIAPSVLRPASDGELEALRTVVTIRQLLSHTACLPEDLPAGRLNYAGKNDLRTISDALIELPLFAPPGTRMRYSNAGVAVLGRLIEHVTGLEFADALRAHVLRPLGLEDTLCRPGPYLDHRIVHMDDAAPSDPEVQFYNSAYWRSLCTPWGGLLGTAADLARFAGAFLEGGQGFLSEGAVREMTNDQTRGVPGEVQSMRITWERAVWGLGWEVKGHKRNHWTGELTSARTFCHFGASGTLLWADPDHNVALAVFGNRTVAHLWPLVPPRWARLSNAVIGAVS